jgi:hypothetical protein
MKILTVCLFEMCKEQCCGSGSVGSIYFWTYRIRINLSRDPNPSITYAKIVRKTLIPTVLLLLYDFLSLKNYVNVPSKSNKEKKLEDHRRK